MFSLIRNLVRFFCVCVCAFAVAGQERSLNEYDAKAHYVYETIKHTKWPDDENLNTIRIGVVAYDTLIVDALHNLMPANGIREKAIGVQQISLDEDDPFSFDIIYLTEKFDHRTSDLVSASSDTLIISEGNIRRDNVMVNIEFSGRDIEVRINRNNLVNKGFQISNSYLDFAGTKEELSDQLQEKQRYLSEILQRVSAKESELEQLNQQLLAQSKELAFSLDKLTQSQQKMEAQEQDITTAKKQLTEFKQKIASSESELLENQQRVKESLAALEEQQSLIAQREARITDMANSISANQAVLDEQKIQIKAQKTIINNKERKIKEQQKLLFLVAGIIFVLLVMAYFLIRFNVLREKHKNKLEELNSQLYELATTDSLTQLFNRRHFVEVTEAHLQHHLRTKSPAVMLMMDIDHFKKVNDTYGHAAGDQAIITTANVLKKSLRPYDVVGRLGGEEFAMMLLDSTMGTAMDVAERLRKEVESTAITFEEQTLNVTISTGISCISADDKEIDDVLVRADKALYDAKESGRNCVKICESAVGH